MNRRFLFPLLLFLMYSFAAAANPGAEPDFNELRARLVADGIDSVTVARFFSDPRFELMRNVLKINVHQPDATDAYAGMVQPQSIAETSSFLNRHRATFDSVLTGSRVDAEVCAAILRVESNLGRFHGTYPLMNVFASLSMLDSDQLETLAPEFWDRILSDFPESEHPGIRERVNQRRSRKARWAYRELKLLLQMAQENRMDPLEVKGSWAGAFGLAQFLPSSYEAYARDGNNDGQVDLYVLEDAIASIANYLAVHGYRAGNEERQRRAIRRYNHSDDYVDAVMTIAQGVAATSDPD